MTAALKIKKPRVVSGAPWASGSTGTVESNNYIYYEFTVSNVACITGLELELGKSYTLRWTQELSVNGRFNCYPSPDPTQAKCEQLGCVWKVDKNYFSKLMRHKYFQNHCFVLMVVTV
ncbi:hypothetical protein Q9233_002367 [Columba guinea]|nr:hypothetical protein Q9233_002367 [Columba guinea]